MRINAVILATVVLLLALEPAARADCQARLDELSPRIAQVTDDTRRPLLEHDLRHARKELAEGDERDCKKILDHAATLLDQH